MLVFFLATQCTAQQLVFIHYANNTAPAGKDAENHRVTIERLESIDHEKAKAIAKNLREEPELMTAALKADRRILRENLVGRLGVALCEFDNQSVRNQSFRYWLPNEEKSADGLIDQSSHVQEVTVPGYEDYIFDENPLATRSGLQASLLAVAKRFPPATHQFILLTQSHGSDKWALTVKLARKHEDVSMAQLAAMFREDAVTYDLPQVGVTKSEYFDVLRYVGEETGMHFPLVILETCQGTIDTPLANELPSNVDLFFSSGHRSLEFRSLPYAEVFGSCNDSFELIGAFDQYLRPSFLRLQHARNWPVWIWSIPLLAILLWQWAGSIQRKRASK